MRMQCVVKWFGMQFDLKSCSNICNKMIKCVISFHILKKRSKYMAESIQHIAFMESSGAVCLCIEMVNTKYHQQDIPHTKKI